MDNNENIVAAAAEAAAETAAAPAAAEENAAPAAVERPERSYAKPPMRRRKKVCQFCADKVDEIDFKEFKSAQSAKAFISERAKILPRRVTGCCAKHQRQLTVAIKRARQLALLPYISD